MTRCASLIPPSLNVEVRVDIQVPVNEARIQAHAKLEVRMARQFG
jgi:hypothetical protein